MAAPAPTRSYGSLGTHSFLQKNPPAVQETWVRSLGWKDPLEKGKATHSSILAWRIPWTIIIHIYIYPWDRKESDTTEGLSLHSFKKIMSHLVHVCVFSSVLLFVKHSCFKDCNCNLTLLKNAFVWGL